MEDIEIIQVALESLEKNTLIKGRYRNTGIKELDGQLELVINGRTIKLNVEIKKELRNYQLNQVINQNTKFGPLIIAANNIFPNLKKELRTNNIAYLDSKGNLYLNQDDIYVWLEANKSDIPEKEKANRVFTKTGLKVLFHLLLFEDNMNKPYRFIAQQTNVGLGNINYIMNGLKKMGFLIKLNEKHYKILKKSELLQKWVIAYEERLKPTLQIGKFRFLKNEDFNNWKKLPTVKGGTLWGSEPAADLFTNHLQPEELTIYTTETRIELMKKLRLVPDENGNVKVYQKFWSFENADDNIVPPMLIYADLINTQESRCIETANKIYDLVLKDEFERN